MIRLVRTGAGGGRGGVTVTRIVAVALVVALASAGWSTTQTEHRDGMLIGAEFRDASPLFTGLDVKVDGVPVGEIVDMRVVERRESRKQARKQARVMLHLTNDALPVYQDASATVRASSLLGEYYVDLDRGSPSAPVMRDGQILPAGQNSQTTQLDQVLNTVDQPTGEALASLITALGHGLDGQGKNVDATLKALAPAMKDTGQLVKILKEQNTLLGNVVDRVEPVASALAHNRGKTLDSLVQATSELTAATAAEQRHLRDTLTQLPATLTEARKVLGQLAGTAEQATPTLKALRPTTDQLSTLSAELKTFAKSATPALAKTQPVLDRANKLLSAARPVAAQLRHASPDLRSVASDARPIVASLAKNIGDVLDFVRYWALATNGYDGISHYFRGQLVISPQMAEMLLPQVTGQAGKKKPGQRQKVADLLSGKLDANDSSPSVGLLAPQDDEGGSATGLNRKQESGVLEFLIGGGQ
ncbi:MlaD family protein [Haloechinothrix salitolerans]|uniref:MlaD family protein n=1 Tax=Haloechinothrix salitolerans TaxID=926830 RepID=A0ABW2BT37_9PSEU